MSEDDLAQLEAKLAAATTDEEVAAVEFDLAVLTGQTVDTLARVAEMFGVGISTVWSWRGGSDPMPGYEGCWNIRDISEWVNRRRSKSRQAETAEQSEQRAALELENLRSAVDLLEIKFREMRAGLVRRDAAAAKLREMLAEAEEFLAQIPGVIVALAPDDLQDILGKTSRQQVELTLRHLRADFEEIARGL